MPGTQSPLFNEQNRRRGKRQGSLTWWGSGMSIKDVPAVCLECGENFLTYRASIPRGEGKYCSRSCASKNAARKRHEIHKQTGANNHNWRGGSSTKPYQYKLNQKEKHPDRMACREECYYAIRHGKLQRQPCEVCGAKDTHAHHDDYTKPLQVRWLCPPCHRWEHQ